MPFLKWDESPHWKARQPVIVEEPPAIIKAELPPPLTRRTIKEITESIQDDPRYNAINPSQQAHIIDMAIAEARNNGMLMEDRENEQELVHG